ncbi:hypothetical protein NXF25_005955 [Crotalus adamanteus]|uniref:Reverse transcriptase domain-containing protein n=1 Tax=Crotalus adamanteus TaxID=8729 RepID=A0AAW1BZ70_CROAD
MGSPISGVIAEAVLQCLESRAMADYQPEFWTRYVDDTFVIVKWARKTALMEKLNSIFPDIQFTAEEEANGSLAFLDVLVTHQFNGALHTTVYRKATHTDRMLHYMSNHPAAHKISCEAEAIAQDASKGGRLLKQAWFSNTDSINRCIELPLAYQALRVQEEHVKRRMPIVRGETRTGGGGYSPHD